MKIQPKQPKKPQQPQKLAKKMPNYVKTADLDPSKVSGKELETKTVNNEPGKTYLQIPLQYEYLSGKDVVRIQLPKVQCSGIKPNKFQAGNFLINVRFDKSNPDCQMFITKFQQVFNVTCDILFQQRKAAKLPYFDPKIPEATKYRSALFYPTDKKTNEPQLDQDPIMQIKLFKYGVHPNISCSLFTDLKKKPIDWDLLNNVSMTIIPLISIQKIYIGSNPSLQVKLVSAVVCSVRGRGSETMQDDAINEELLANPDADFELEEQLAQMMASKNSPNDKFESNSGSNSDFNVSTSNSNESANSQMQNFLSNNKPQMKPLASQQPSSHGSSNLHGSTSEVESTPTVQKPTPSFTLPNPAMAAGVPHMNIIRQAN